MNKPREIFEQLADAVAGALPVDPGAEVRKSLRASLRSACERLNLVTREEVEVQEAVLQRTREKVERLEAQVAELESRLLKGSKTI